MIIERKNEKKSARKVGCMYIRIKIARSNNQSYGAEFEMFNQKFRNGHLDFGRFSVKRM